MALEKRFNSFQKVVERIEKDAESFRDSIAALLSHQAAMAAHLTVIYDTQLGVQATEQGGVQRRFQQTPAAATQAANDAEAAMAYCRDEVLPELDGIDRDVIRPMLEFKEIMKTIQKTMVKRNHKMIDYDRHRASLAKLKAKEERSFNEEKQIFKVEAQLETATQDYQYLNDLLKQELPRFFALKSQFIQPVFEHLYEMQLKIYGMIYARCYELINANQSHFVTHQMPIEEGYNWRTSQYNVREELENLDLLKSGGKAWLAVSGGANNSKLSLKERAALRAQEQEHGKHPSPYRPYDAEEGPPAYGATGGTTLDATPMAYGKQQYPQNSGSRSGPAPPPPPAIANTSSAQYVLALYDYDAQAEGDLSFRKDDKIEVIQRTADKNDWWTGRLNGVTGIFPGNYVSDM
ncbi:hypothetical protein BX666DRAFT_1898634 [Dichotomocladium elegans]|nr:hypothetical protein BX666DRAFT_1898634 [Dichotomocladium elegans]